MTRRIFTVAVCAAAMSFSAAQAFDMDKAVGIWLFDDGGGNTADDSSGNKLHAELNGDPEWVEGRFGGALEFDGAGDYVRTPDHASPRDAITVIAVVKSAAAAWNTSGAIVGKRSVYILHPNAGGTVVAFPVCNGGCWNQPNSWNTGQIAAGDITVWRSYIGTFDSATGDWRLYIDGKVESELNLNAAQLVEHTESMTIGFDDCCGGGRFLNGSIDEVAVFGYAMSADEVAQIADQGLSASLLSVDPSGKAPLAWGSIKKRAAQ